MVSYSLPPLMTPRRITLCSFDPGEVKKKKKKKKSKKKKRVEQGDPPRTGLSKVYQDGKYPVGEIQEYKNEWVTHEYVQHGLKLSPVLVMCGVPRQRRSAILRNWPWRIPILHMRTSGVVPKYI